MQAAYMKTEILISLKGLVFNLGTIKMDYRYQNGQLTCLGKYQLGMLDENNQLESSLIIKKELSPIPIQDPVRQEPLPLPSMREFQREKFVPRYPIHGFTQAPELGKTIKKRILRSRIRFKEEQVIELERAFQKTHYLNAQLRQELAMKINLNEERVGMWFKNRRSKQKKLEKGTIPQAKVPRA